MKKKSSVVFVCFSVIFLILLAISIGILVEYIQLNEGEPNIEAIAKPFNEWKFEYENSGRAVYSATLPGNMNDDMYMAYAARFDFSIYVDGKLRKRFDTSENSVPGKMVKTEYFYVPLHKEDSGKTITIIKDSVTTDYMCSKDIYIGNSVGIYRHYLNNSFTQIGAAIVLSVLAGLMLFIGILLSLYTKRLQTMFTLSVGILACCIWLIFDNDTFQFLFDRMYIDGVFAYFLCMLLAFPFMLSVYVLQEGRYRKFYVFMMSVQMSAFIAFTLSHFTGGRSFLDNLIYELILDAVYAVGVLITIIIDLCKRRTERYFVIAYGYIALVLCIIIDLLRILMTKEGTTGQFVTAGMYILVMSCIIHTVMELMAISRQKDEAMLQNRAKTDFLAKMSHEIRTPINSILGMNEMIKRECESEDIAEYAHTIEVSGNYLMSIINDILDISKIEAGKTEILNNDFEMREFLQQLADVCIERCERKDITPVIEFDKNLPSVIYGDEIHIKQIAVNLITNACKYTEKGSVTVRVSQIAGDDNKLVIAVEDTGMGIREEDRELLFETFTRLDLNRNKSIQGTGLGLSIVKGLLDMMGGSIEVASEYGRGSSFTVTIPVTVRDASPINEISTRSKQQEDKDKYKPRIDGAGKTILVVDDIKQNLMVIKYYLKTTNLTVDMAESGRLSVEMCQKKQYDLILMDHMMPEMDGIEAFEAIRADKDGLNRETPVIVLTANAIEGVRQEYLGKGFTDYLSKPVMPKQLEDMILKYVEA